MEKPVALLEEAKRLVKLAEGQPEELQLILYAAAVEACIAAILSTSTPRRSKRLCTASTRRLINMALVELARLRIIDSDEAASLRRKLHALRCNRNRLLHPWGCSEDAKCEEITTREAREAVEKLLEATGRLLTLRGFRIATAKTP